ncbi:hypothetical protein ERJ75_001438700 [Trypanosoma vivax]|nr:hypothetical protein ERJ75_001438700 [Trypanosoma vivax]
MQPREHVHCPEPSTQEAMGTSKLDVNRLKEERPPATDGTSKHGDFDVGTNHKRRFISGAGSQNRNSGQNIRLQAKEKRQWNAVNSSNNLVIDFVVASKLSTTVYEEIRADNATENRTNLCSIAESVTTALIALVNARALS